MTKSTNASRSAKSGNGADDWEGLVIDPNRFIREIKDRFGLSDETAREIAKTAVAMAVSGIGGDFIEALGKVSSIRIFEENEALK